MSPGFIPLQWCQLNIMNICEPIFYHVLLAEHMTQMTGLSVLYKISYTIANLCMSVAHQLAICFPFGYNLHWHVQYATAFTVELAFKKMQLEKPFICRVLLILWLILMIEGKDVIVSSPETNKMGNWPLKPGRLELCKGSAS